MSVPRPSENVATENGHGKEHVGSLTNQRKTRMQTVFFSRFVLNLLIERSFVRTPPRRYTYSPTSQRIRKKRKQSMEASPAVICRPIPFVSGGSGVESQPYSASLLGFFHGASMGTQRNLRASRQSLKVSSLSSFVLFDQNYVNYYSSGRKIRCGACKEKIKEEKEMKKRLKRLKGLPKDLALYSRMDDISVDPLKAKMISEAAELLQGQLQQLRSEKKKLKQRRKEEKSGLNLKASKIQKSLELQVSSSSSSESSDSDRDCGNAVDMNLSNYNPREKHIPDATEQILDNGTLALPDTSMTTEETLDNLPEGNSATAGRGIKTCFNSGSQEQGWSSDVSNIYGDRAGLTGSMNLASKKIEVCMGSKCKKSGAELLMQEFQMVLGSEAAVSGCKCMGKCRNGPNVRILDNIDEDIGRYSSTRAC